MTQSSTNDLVADALGDAPALLSFRRAEEVTGIPARTWHRWVREGHVRVVRPCGKHPRLARTELARILREGAANG
jgi:excisionase family DNA binding protein